MKLTLEWLRDHLDGDFTVEDVVATLNRIGHEVEGVENPAERLAGFRIAKVLTAEKHPQADTLQVLTVDAGDGTPPTRLLYVTDPDGWWRPRRSGRRRGRGRR